MSLPIEVGQAPRNPDSACFRLDQM